MSVQFFQDHIQDIRCVPGNILKQPGFNLLSCAYQVHPAITAWADYKVFFLERPKGHPYVIFWNCRTVTADQDYISVSLFEMVPECIDYFFTKVISALIEELQFVLFRNLHEEGMVLRRRAPEKLVKPFHTHKPGGDLSNERFIDPQSLLLPEVLLQPCFNSTRQRGFHKSNQGLFHITKRLVQLRRIYSSSV